jgi:hypothetical protein
MPEAAVSRITGLPDDGPKDAHQMLAPSCWLDAYMIRAGVCILEATLTRTIASFL